MKSEMCLHSTVETEELTHDPVHHYVVRFSVFCLLYAGIIDF